jgi:hypothetical protein
MEDILVDKIPLVTVDPSIASTRMSIEDWAKLDRKVKSTIQLCLLDSILLNVSGEVTTKYLWNKLGNLYQSKSMVNKLFL